MKKEKNRHCCVAVLMLSCLLSVVLRGQTSFKGFVRSGMDSMGLPAKIIMLHQKNVVDSIRSKKDGSFSIVLTNGIDAIASKGFKDTILELSTLSTVDNIYLEQETTLLQTVTIVTRNKLGSTIKSDKVTYSLKKISLP